MTPHLLDDRRRDEGLRLRAYPDPITGAAPWTIGFGHTGPEVRPGLVWTQAQAEAALAADVVVKVKALDANLPWWRGLSPARQDVLANMAYNLGVYGLTEFHTFLAFLREDEFDAAASDLETTAWAREVGARARRLIAQLRTGVRQP